MIGYRANSTGATGIFLDTWINTTSGSTCQAQGTFIICGASYFNRRSFKIKKSVKNLTVVTVKVKSPK
jgi:hypothetical protein